MEALSWCRRGS